MQTEYGGNVFCWPVAGICHLSVGLVILFALAAWADNKPRPLADDGKGRLYVFALSSDFLEKDSYCEDRSFSISKRAIDNYMARIKRDYPKAEIRFLSPLNWKTLEPLYREMKEKGYSKIDIFFWAHGNNSGGKYHLLFDDQETIDPEKWANPPVKANFYLLTCFAGAAFQCGCIPKAQQVYYAMPAIESRTMQVDFALNMESVAKDNRTLPESPFEYWRRADEMSLKRNIRCRKEFGDLGGQSPGSGCSIGSKIYGAVDEKTTKEYERTRQDEMNRHLGSANTHGP